MSLRTQKKIVWGIVFIWAVFWLVFAALSGAEGGAGLAGLWRNAPNALPELFFLLIVLWAWRKPFAGGWALVGVALFTLIFFSSWKNPFVFCCLTLPPLAGGLKLTHIGNLELFEK